MTETWQTIQFPSSESAIALAGHQETNLKLIARQTGANLVLRGMELRIAGQPTPVERATAIVRSLSILWQEAKLIAEADIMTAIHALDTGRSSEYKELQQDILARTRRGELIRAKPSVSVNISKRFKVTILLFVLGRPARVKPF